MAVLHLSASLSLAIHDSSCVRSALKSPSSPRVSVPNFSPIGTAFATGSPLVISKSTGREKFARRAKSVSIRCEQSSQEGTLDVWLGRSAMVGFAAAISVEIATGKGLLENFGLTSPLPTVALGVTALVGILTAVFIFQSASKN